MFPLFELVAIGGIIFWILAGSLIAAMVTAVERDEPVLATFMTVGALIFLTLFTTFNPFAWMWANSGLILLLAAAYVVIGVGWTVAKWYFFNLGIASKLRSVRNDWMKSNPRRRGEAGVLHISAGHIDRDGDEPLESLEHYEMRFLFEQRHLIGMSIDKIPLNVKEHKGRIMTWMVYWPFSAVWTLLNDPIRHLWNFIYERIGGSLQSISNRVFRDIRLNVESK